MQLKFAMAATLKYLHYQGHGHGGIGSQCPLHFANVVLGISLKSMKKQLRGVVANLQRNRGRG